MVRFKREFVVIAHPKNGGQQTNTNQKLPINRPIIQESLVCSPGSGLSVGAGLGVIKGTSRYPKLYGLAAE
jgi:hypothetical protein